MSNERVIEVISGGINEIVVRTISHGYRFTKGGSDEDTTHIYTGTVQGEQTVPIDNVPSVVFDALEKQGHSPNRQTTPHPAGRDISLSDK